MLAFFFTIMPKIRELNPRHPMLLGFGSFILSQLLLILSPEKSYLMILISTFLEAVQHCHRQHYAGPAHSCRPWTQTSGLVLWQSCMWLSFYSPRPSVGLQGIYHSSTAFCLLY
jgi:hypothetical protein